MRHCRLHRPEKCCARILEGLRLEYRGYDSAGIAVVDAAGKMEIRRAPGKLRNLERPSGNAARRRLRHRAHALGHARASHGRKCAPAPRLHREIVVVHNGIIENYIELKEKLQKAGPQVRHRNDTEIVAHLVEEYAKTLPFEEAVGRTLKDLRGIYSLVFLSAKDPQKLIAARIGPPS